MESVVLCMLICAISGFASLFIYILYVRSVASLNERFNIEKLLEEADAVWNKMCSTWKKSKPKALFMFFYSFYASYRRFKGAAVVGFIDLVLVDGLLVITTGTAAIGIWDVVLFILQWISQPGT